jgi:RNA polymerase sigma factor (sigma-70 family)
VYDIVRFGHLRVYIDEREVQHLLVPELYDAVWRVVRQGIRGYRPLSHEFLWHQVYRLYVEELPKPVAAFQAAIGRCGCEFCRNVLIECHLRIVGPIAGQIARRRFPSTFGSVPNSHARDGHADLVHELIATGNLGLFEAVDHFKPEAGRLSTIANFWIRKRIYEGDRARGIFGREGLVTPCYLPKRHLATFSVGLTGTKSANCPDANPDDDDDDDDDEFDLLDSDGRTSRKYLQRCPVGNGGARFLWRDEGTYAVPRLKLPGHPGGEASRELVSEAERDFEKRGRDWQDNCFLETVGQTAKRVLTPAEYRVFAARFLHKKKPTRQALADELGLHESGVRRIKARALRKVWNAPPLQIAQTVEAMAKFYSVAPGDGLDEFVDVAKKKFPNATAEQRHAAWIATGLFDSTIECSPLRWGQGSFNSWGFAKVSEVKPKPLPQPKHVKPWTHSVPFAVAWLRRHGRKLQPWLKPSHDWYASRALAA